MLESNKLNYIQSHLPIDLDTFGFVVREKINGKPVKNKCGRDFLYYALAYYKPTKFGPVGITPTALDVKKLLGTPTPSYLVWTCLPFYRSPKYFKEHGLGLHINREEILSWTDFLKAMMFPKRMTFEETISFIKEKVDAGIVCGIDIPLSLGGLVDHVMFVYGYDDKNLYVFDTHQVGRLGYEKITPPGDARFIMKLPIAVIASNWSRLNRLWIIQPTSPSPLA